MKAKRGVKKEREFQGNTIIFDLGGVIAFYDQMIIAKGLEPILHVPAKRIFEVISSSTNEFANALEKGKSPRVYLKILARDLGIKKVRLKDLKKYWNNIFWPNKEIVKIIKALKENYTLVLLSNIGKIHEKYLSKEYKLHSLFSVRIFSYKVKARKPGAEIFNLTLRKLKIKPEQAIFIDDKLENIQGAEKVGINPILFKNNLDLIIHLKKLGVKI